MYLIITLNRSKVARCMLLKGQIYLTEWSNTCNPSQTANDQFLITIVHLHLSPTEKKTEHIRRHVEKKSSCIIKNIRFMIFKQTPHDQQLQTQILPNQQNLISNSFGNYTDPHTQIQRPGKQKNIILRRPCVNMVIPVGHLSKLSGLLKKAPADRGEKDNCSIS